MTNIVLSKTQNNTAIITLNHPEKSNCLSPDMINKLITTYQHAEKNSEIHAIILHANGKHFCAGADLNHMKAMTNASYEENIKDARALAEFFYIIYSCQKPTICCAHGKTIGGGIGLMAVHDMTIATCDAEFCFPEVNIGIMPATIAPFVAQRIGFQKAKQWMLTAELFSAKIACEMQLIDHVCENAPLDFAMHIAENVSKNNLNAMQKTKQWLQE